MGYKTIKYEINNCIAPDNCIAVISFNRPDVLNALNLEVLTDTLDAVAKADADNKVKAIILTGEGRSFVAGADISGMNSLTSKEAFEFSLLGHRVMNALEGASIPVLAAVNGFALGGGMELCLACDFVFASKKAKFGQPELNLGVIPGFGGTQRLVHVVGINKARELIYTCDMIDADEAKRIGLVAEVYEPDQLMSKVIEKAKIVMSKGPCAVAAAKRVMNKGRGISVDAALELEMQAFSGLFGTHDQVEGMSAFLDKRPPKFENK